MRFYTKAHQWYCGIDLHARTMYVCILDRNGEMMLHRNMKTTPEVFLKAIAPYRNDIVVAVECMFTWYWLADLCVQKDIEFVLGHAQYMKAIHGGKAKNDRIDAHKIAVLLRGGMLPQSGLDHGIGHPKHSGYARKCLKHYKFAFEKAPIIMPGGRKWPTR